MLGKKKKKSVSNQAGPKKKSVKKKPAKKTIPAKKTPAKKPLKKKKKGRGPGRPRIEIDWTAFEKLCAIHCTLIEIAEWFDCSEDTIERHVKKKYKENFADVFKKKSGRGKISLRRKQFELANAGDRTMLIWLGKQCLGQADKQAQGVMGKDGELRDPQKPEKITPEMTDKAAEFIYIKTIRDRKKK